VQGERALERARQRRERGYEAWALRLLGEIAVSRNPPDVHVAETYFRDALARGRALDMRPLVARCHLGLGCLYARLEARKQADMEFQSAADMFGEMKMVFWMERARERAAAL
jgi:hypothetical protein